MLQDIEKMKVQYLMNLLFDLFEILQAVRTWQRNFASFQILLLWQPESKTDENDPASDKLSEYLFGNDLSE